MQTHILSLRTPSTSGLRSKGQNIFFLQVVRQIKRKEA